MKTIEKIKNKIKELNKSENNLLYWISVAIIVLIGIFVFITMVIQTQWVGISTIECPMLVWIIGSPNVGVFFLPFILLLSYVCWFIISVGKPITIKRVMNDSRSLYENHEINKNEYESIYNELSIALKRKSDELEQENQKLKEELNNLKNNIEEGENNLNEEDI